VRGTSRGPVVEAQLTLLHFPVHRPRLDQVLHLQLDGLGSLENGPLDFRSQIRRVDEPAARMGQHRAG